MPQVIPAQNNGLQTLQEGIASLQRAMQFIEQKRQFDTEQARLDQVSKMNQTWKFIDDLAKQTESGSINDVARKYPSLLSFAFQNGFGVSEGMATEIIGKMASSPYSGDALMRILHMNLKYGDTTEPLDTEKAIKNFGKQLDEGVAQQAGGTAAAGAAAAEVPSGKLPATGKPVVSKTEITPATKVAGGMQSPVERLKTQLASSKDSALGNYAPIVQDFMKTLTDPSDKKAVEDWIGSSDYQSFIQSMSSSSGNAMGLANYVPTTGPSNPQFVQAEPTTGRRELGKEALGAKTGETPTAMVPSSSSQDEKRAFADWLYVNGKSRVPASGMRQETLDNITVGNEGLLDKFRKEQGQTAARPSPAPAPEAETPQRKKVQNALTSLTKAVDSGKVGQQKLFGRKLSVALTPEVQQKLQETPEGRRQLFLDAVATLNDPNFIKAMAVLQNASSVYATDQAQQGNEAEADYRLKKLYLEFEKAGYDTETARLNMIKAGQETTKGQYEMFGLAMTNSMIFSGKMLPDLIQKRVDVLSEDTNKQMQILANKNLNEAQKKSASDRINKNNTETLALINSWSEQLKAHGGRAATELASLFSQVAKIGVKQGFFWKVKRFLGMTSDTGQTIGASQQAASPATVEIPKDEQAFSDKYNLGGE